MDEDTVIDVNQTLKVNSLQVVFRLLCLAALVLYINLFAETIQGFVLPEMQVIALFVYGYSVMKMLAAIVLFDVEIVYKAEGALP